MSTLPVAMGSSTTMWLPSPRRVVMEHVRPAAGRLSDAGQSEALFAGTLRVETGSPILHADPQGLAMLREFQVDLVALAVLAGVGETFLGNAIDGVLQRRVQPANVTSCWNSIRVPHRAMLSYTRCCRAATTPIRVQDGRPQAADEPSDFGVTLPQQFGHGSATCAAAFGVSRRMVS